LNSPSFQYPTIPGFHFFLFNAGGAAQLEGKMRTAFLFPGQGAQQVGMGHDLYRDLSCAKRLFDEAEAATHLPLRKVCFEGPSEELARTDICQPAIFTVSAATLAAMRDLLSPEQLEKARPAFLAGLSLGEYTALYAGGAVDFQSAVRLVARRGLLMQEAAIAVPSGMVSILGLDQAKAQELCRAASDGQVLVCANFNCPGQIVLSGHLEACRRAEAMAKDFGASGAVPLKVAGAFHSPLMQSAADGLAEALKKVELRRPKTPVISNVTARPHGDPGSIRKLLVDQLTSPVLWQQGCEYLAQNGMDQAVEVGPGRVLAGLMRRINSRIRVTCLNSRQAVEKLGGVAAPHGL
jgi:[acyl-carrier-protein] S-malonyltransferase